MEEEALCYVFFALLTGMFYSASLFFNSEVFLGLSLFSVTVTIFFRWNIQRILKELDDEDQKK